MSGLAVTLNLKI